MLRHFDDVHLSTLAIIFGVTGFLILLARHPRTRFLARPTSLFLAIVIIINELIFIALVFSTGQWDFRRFLPLNLCDLTIFIVTFSLIWHRQWVWEVAYFWTLGGSLQAIVSPDLGVTYPDYFYIKFFLTHGLLVIGVCFLAAGCGRKIYRESIRRVFMITNIYAVVIGIFNLAFDTNYSYLCEKPSQPSILDYLGPWPYYIVSLEGVLLISLIFYYLPFYITEKIKTKI